MFKRNLKLINVKYFSTRKKCILGINVKENPQKINFGVIDLNGNILSKNIISCEKLNLNDVKYLSILRAEKLKEICKKK
jgi:hypothetical protein